MDWALPIERELDSYGEDIDIHALGLPRPMKSPGYFYSKKKKSKPVLTLIVDNTKER